MEGLCTSRLCESKEPFEKQEKLQRLHSKLKQKQADLISGDNKNLQFRILIVC